MKTDELIAKAAAESTGLQIGDLFFFVLIPVVIILGLIYARAKAKKSAAHHEGLNECNDTTGLDMDLDLDARHRWGSEGE